MTIALPFVAEPNRDNSYWLNTLRPETLPDPADARLAEIGWENWRHSVPAADAIAAWPPAERWLSALFGNSPYLTQLALREADTVLSLLAQGPDATFAELRAKLNEESLAKEERVAARTAFMRALRQLKRRVALIAAMADIAGLWSLQQVTGALSWLADYCVSQALDHVLAAASANGRLAPAPSGIFVLGMGKLGACELNYSSDIDIIVMFDPSKLEFRGTGDAQTLMTRLTRDLLTLIEERTPDGYVFRTDIRLRPDPGSTPPAISVATAELYYGSLGQNWERAAMIKARPIAGDIEAGRTFLDRLTPFIWRKNLDFAAIQDIESLKRQIDARHRRPEGELFDFNVKLGHGGIREIELFVQTQQLIWGGRMPSLRQSGTIAALAALVEAERIEAATARDLEAAYFYLRRVEHRLQMIEDRQTHSLPREPEAFRRFAVFMGEASSEAFARRLAAYLAIVRGHFAGLFAQSPALSAAGNLVFTGVEDDPETLATLRGLGFADVAQIAATIRGWHHGRIRATRSQRARELLTELVPRLLQVLGRTASPDDSFRHFDRFLGNLPAGVQLFALFRSNPAILALLAEIMGEAPGLAQRLSRRPALLDTVLTAEFTSFGRPEHAPSRTSFDTELQRLAAQTRDYEALLDTFRRWTADRRFGIGVNLLLGRIDAEAAARYFTWLAEAVVAALVPAVEAYFEASHGRIEAGRFAVLALGKLGSAELTQTSDLDLIFIYDLPESAGASTGPKPLDPLSYYARLAQRLINALTAPTAEGVLYTVDMRLRPSGNAGPIASSLSAFAAYQREKAWTWEHLALTRARVVAGEASLGAEIEATVKTVLTEPREPRALQAEVAAMRQRIQDRRPRPPGGWQPWHAKHRPGGLVDIEFAAQYLQLRHAARHPEILSPKTATALARLDALDLIPEGRGSCLLEGLLLWHRIQALLRVALIDVDPATADPALLDRLLARATGIADRNERSAMVERVARGVRECYEAVLGPDPI